MIENKQSSHPTTKDIPLDSQIEEAIKEYVINAVRVQETLILQHVQESFSGPLPHPKHLKEYKNIDKTYPDRIMAMAEKKESHIAFVQKVQVIQDFVLSLLGWLTSTGISSYSLYQSVELVKAGKNIESVIALTTALGTIGGAFYISKKLSSQNNKK